MDFHEIKIWKFTFQQSPAGHLFLINPKRTDFITNFPIPLKKPIKRYKIKIIYVSNKIFKFKNNAKARFHNKPY